MRQRDQLGFYAGRFDTVEVNATFYRLARGQATQVWHDLTPDGFTFACKGSRYLTHMKRLREPEEGLRRFFAPLAPLEDKLGPVVFQLPGRFRPDPARLADFLRKLPEKHRYAFEFRNPDWFDPPVLALLRARGVALCLYDFAGRQSPLEVTAGFVYIRLHGPGAAYQGSYSDRALAMWAERLQGWQAQGLDAWCFFDNDQHGYAPNDALRLKRLTA